MVGQGGRGGLSLLALECGAVGAARGNFGTQVTS